MDFLEQFVTLTVATVKADREMSQKEIDTIVLLAEGLKLDTETVAKAIKTKMYQHDSAEAIARSVAAENKLVIMQACILVALADNKLKMQEVEFLNKINAAFGLPQAAFVLAIASVCQNNPQIEIEGNVTNSDKKD